MFIEALFVKDKNKKQPQRPSMDKQAVVRPYHGIVLTRERNEILIYATTWVDLKSIMLSWKS